VWGVTGGLWVISLSRYVYVFTPPRPPPSN
jgi:hypothetical protein